MKPCSPETSNLASLAVSPCVRVIYGVSHSREGSKRGTPTEYEREMSHAGEALRLPKEEGCGLRRWARMDSSSGICSGSSDARMVVVLGGGIAAACFGGAAWAFSSVAPKAYMVSECQDTRNDREYSSQLRVTYKVAEYPSFVCMRLKKNTNSAAATTAKLLLCYHIYVSRMYPAAHTFWIGFPREIFFS